MNRLATTMTLSAAMLCCAGAAMANDADLSVSYSPHTHYSCNTNLGPTGAAAWLRGYDFVVVAIQRHSPGHGKLMLGDVIIGTGDTEFGPDADPRITLGNAIDQAEGSGKPLKLHVIRRGKRQVVSIDLPQLGAYAPTWPYHCDKSKKILDAACLSIVDRQMPDGNVVTDGSFGLFVSGLALLGSADAKYLDPARRAAYAAMNADFSPKSYNNWSMGHGGLLMAEYFLATGDDSVLAVLQQVCDKMVEGQMRCGSWGHRSPAGGYGALNQAGIVNVLTLVLAKECGVDVDEAALQKSLDFFAKFAATGSVPYGDHGPYRTLDNNGKNATAAIVFHLAGRAFEANAFAASTAESYWLREQGHTGAYFSYIWGPLGAALAGEEKLRSFLDYQKWYFDMSRKWTGGITMLPYKEALTRFDGSSYIEPGPDFTTGGMVLGYTLPMKHMRITGAGPSVFGTRANLSGDLLAARNYYAARRWAECDETLAAINPDALADDQQRRWLEQLTNARALAKASTDRVLAEIDCNLEAGAAYRALKQFEALTRAYGESADPRFAQVQERLDQNAWFIKEGTRFYERLAAIQIAQCLSWTPQGRMARRMFEATPSARIPHWQPLSPSSQLTPQTWRTRRYAAGDVPNDGWHKPGFDDSDWQQGAGIITRQHEDADDANSGPIAARRAFTVDNTAGKALRVRLRTVRNALTRVYLNGKLIVDVERGQRGGYATITLDDRALGLLNQGDNLLAVTSTVQGSGNNHLDVALEISRDGTDRRALPIDRAVHPHTAHLPDRVNTLTVDETTREFAAALKESYHAMPLDRLLSELTSVIAYYRMLAEDALVAKGLDGVRPAMALIDHAHWYTRASAMSLITKAHKKFTADGDKAGLAFLAEQLPRVAERVVDEHLWVRTQACNALAEFGEQAKGEAALLRRAAMSDADEWVRTAAIEALKKIGAPADELHRVAHNAVQADNSAFGIARRAVSVVREPAGDDRKKLMILAELLRNPPEGGGGALLTQAIAMACDLDPDGDVMIPLLIDAAADKTHLSRQRGGPWARSIEALGGYGAKAAAAIPVLRQLLADESKDKIHETAQAALDKITGQPTVGDAG